MCKGHNEKVEKCYTTIEISYIIHTFKKPGRFFSLTGSFNNCRSIGDYDFYNAADFLYFSTVNRAIR